MIAQRLSIWPAYLAGIAMIALSVYISAVYGNLPEIKPEPEPVEETAEETQENVPEKTEETVEIPVITYDSFWDAEIKQAYNANNDTVGWLTISGCEIDNSVLQGSDNSYYLRKTESLAYSVWGCYFMDYRNTVTETDIMDRVTIIYGHSLGNDKNASKFSKLKRYKDEDFALSHKTVELDTLYKPHYFTVCAASDVPVTFDYLQVNPDDSKFASVVDYIMSRSYVDFGEEIDSDDQLLILSTCTFDDDLRYVILCKMVEEK